MTQRLWNYKRAVRPWTYKGVLVTPAGRNASGIRWSAYCGIGVCLRSDTKAGMRELINESISTTFTEQR